jgi:hypothetical protein
MPGCLVDDEPDLGILRGGIRTADVLQGPGTRGWHVALSGQRRGPWAVGAATLHQARGQATGDQMEGPDDLAPLMTIQVAHHRSRPCEPQGRPQSGNHGKTRLILTQQAQCPRVSFV